MCDTCVEKVDMESAIAELLVNGPILDMSDETIDGYAVVDEDGNLPENDVVGFTTYLEGARFLGLLLKEPYTITSAEVTLSKCTDPGCGHGICQRPVFVLVHTSGERKGQIDGLDRGVPSVFTNEGAASQDASASESAMDVVAATLTIYG